MNYALAFALSILDSIAILPFNSELSLLYIVKSKKYTFLQYISIATLLYILPSMLGTIAAYYVGYWFSDFIIDYISFLLNTIFMVTIQITKSNILTTLFLKIFMPIVPISLINLLCGIYGANIICFIVMSLVLRIARVMFMYNAVLFSGLYQYIALIFYSGILSLSTRILLVIFYHILFTQ